MRSRKRGTFYQTKRKKIRECEEPEEQTIEKQEEGDILSNQAEENTGVLAVDVIEVSQEAEEMKMCRQEGVIKQKFRGWKIEENRCMKIINGQVYVMDKEVFKEIGCVVYKKCRHIGIGY